MKAKLGGRTWAALLTFGLVGQIAWVIENMYFNVFLYNTISGDTSMIAAMVAWSAVTATVTTLVMGALSDRLGRRKALIVAGNAVMLGCLFGLWWFAAASPAVVTGTPGQGKQRPFIRRTPRVGKIDERRIAATAEQTSDYANSLIRQGILVQDGPGEWHLDPAGSGDGLTGTFPED